MRRSLALVAVLRRGRSSPGRQQGHRAAARPDRRPAEPDRGPAAHRPRRATRRSGGSTSRWPSRTPSCAQGRSQDRRIQDEAIAGRAARTWTERLAELSERCDVPARQLGRGRRRRPRPPAAARRPRHGAPRRPGPARPGRRGAAAGRRHRPAAARALQPGLRGLRPRQLRPRHPGVPGVPAQLPGHRPLATTRSTGSASASTRSRSTRRPSRPGTSCSAQYPSSDKLPDARFKKGMALERLGRRARRSSSTVSWPSAIPNSEAGRKAREKLDPRSRGRHRHDVRRRGSRHGQRQPSHPDREPGPGPGDPLHPGRRAHRQLLAWPPTSAGRTRAARSRSARSGTGSRSSARPPRSCATTQQGPAGLRRGQHPLRRVDGQGRQQAQHDQDPHQRPQLAAGPAGQPRRGRRAAAAARRGRRREPPAARPPADDFQVSDDDVPF